MTLRDKRWKLTASQHRQIRKIIQNCRACKTRKYRHMRDIARRYGVTIKWLAIIETSNCCRYCRANN